MMKEKQIIYLDILGYDNLAKTIEKEKGIKASKIREDFLKIIDEKISNLPGKYQVAGVSPGRDDRIIVIEDENIITPFNSCFKIIAEILNHDTGYGLKFNKIPLEIGIGIGDYEEGKNLEGEALIREQSTIDFLKSYLLDNYHEWYRKKYEKSIENSYVVLAEKVYNKLNLVDKKYCKEINQSIKDKNGREKVLTFYEMDIDYINELHQLSLFLEKIGFSYNSINNRINYIYTQPLEFNEILKSLNKRNIVFITGTPEYGKTFTAIYLMWNFFKLGYTPIWIHGEEPYKREEVRSSLENVDYVLKAKHIIYFEDPFGKITYEKRENLEREINTIIECVERSEDVYVIITSREEIFKLFKREAISKILLENYEKKLNILKPSYEFGERREIFLKWATYVNCKWLNNQNLISYIEFKLTDEKNLPTPLSIKDFVFSSKNINNIEELEEIIRNKSFETSQAFAKEIFQMSDEKKLFLSILMITNPIDYRSFNSYYLEISSELDAYSQLSFTELVNWFNNDKIEIYTSPHEIRIISFAHPSYIEAINYLFTDD